MRGISRSFGKLAANSDVDFDVRPGEIHALLGENGAGKTTLLRILSGYLKPDAGQILIDGTATEIRDPRAALDLGIGMVHQHSVLVPQLTVAENVMLGRQPSWFSRYSRKGLQQHVGDVCREYGVELDPDAHLQDLPADRVQQVEIIRLLHRQVRTLILDEPTAILGRVYVDRLFETLSDLRARGHSIVIITHKLREVMALADRVTVMRDGRVTASLNQDQFDEERLTSALIERSAQTATRPIRPAPSPDAEVALSVRDLCVVGDRQEQAVDDLSLEVKSGEILGIAGVEGNGQRELIEALSGLRSMVSGSVAFAGQSWTSLRPADLDRAGVAVISEDRLRWDVVADLTLSENLMLSRISRRDPELVRFGLLRRKQMAVLADEQLRRFNVRPADPTMAAGKLSGGNQQKMVLAREIDENPRIVIAAHPARGLDLASTQFVHEKLLELRDRGSAILLVSADLEELQALSSRLLVMYRGRPVFECDAADVDTAEIGRAMIGASS